MSENFSRQSTHATDNYDNFHQTIMAPFRGVTNRRPRMYIKPLKPRTTTYVRSDYGGAETCSQCFTPLTSNQGNVAEDVCLFL